MNQGHHQVTFSKKFAESTRERGENSRELDSLKKQIDLLRVPALALQKLQEEQMNFDENMKKDSENGGLRLLDQLVIQLPAHMSSTQSNGKHSFRVENLEPFLGHRLKWETLMT